MEIKFTNAQIDKYCIELANQIKIKEKQYKYLHPIPRGGYPVAARLSFLLNIPISPTILAGQCLIVDDLIDSGKTLNNYKNCDKAVLFVKNNKVNEVTYYAAKKEGWIVFPWEDEDSGIEDHITRIIEYIGDDPNRIGLKDTPKRVIKMYRELFKGYDKKQAPKITIFPNGQDGVQYDSMICDTGSFYSHCEHHMIPFFGQYWFAYIPKKNGPILGLSKVARVIDFLSAKLQIQERLVEEISYYILDRLNNEVEGLALCMEAEHLCKTMRGVRKKGNMRTVKLTGVFKKIEVRDEFFNYINARNII